jgi:Arc/MetJ-type ribon-helix-helix transcriptional regulator
VTYRPELPDELKEDVEQFLSSRDDIYLTKPDFIRQAVQEKLERESEPESNQLTASEKQLLKEFVNGRLRS